MKFSVTLYYLYNLTFCVLHLSALCLYKELKILQKEELTAVLFFYSCSPRDVYKTEGPDEEQKVSSFYFTSPELFWNDNVGNFIFV